MRLLTLAGLFFFAAALNAAEIKIESVEGQSQYTVKFPEASDLSGITWVRGDLYYVVSNRKKALIPLRLTLDQKGAIVDAKFDPLIPVKSSADDFEGVAYWPAKDRLYVSTERPPALVGFSRSGGTSFPVQVPKVYSKARTNKGLEALAYGAGSFWTANEDALSVDGEQSSASAGALVRLQKFDERFRPAGQYAYRTEPSLLRVRNTGTGVTELAVEPGGELLVLERVVGLGMWAKIYSVNTAGATNTTSMPMLTDSSATPVTKRLLFERATGAGNFEGMVIGPVLAEGWRSVILVADNNGGDTHTFIPLRMKAGTEGKR